MTLVHNAELGIDVAVRDTPETGYPKRTTAYTVRAPLNATFRLGQYGLLALQDNIDGVAPEETAAKCAELSGGEIDLSSPARYIREAQKAAKARTLAELTCKATVLFGSVIPSGGGSPPGGLPKRCSTVLAANGAGYNERGIDFLPIKPETARGYMVEARQLMGIPGAANEAATMARAFACGVFVVGEPYVPSV